MKLTLEPWYCGLPSDQPLSRDLFGHTQSSVCQCGCSNRTRPGSQAHLAAESAATLLRMTASTAESSKRGPAAVPAAPAESDGQTTSSSSQDGATPTRSSISVEVPAGTDKHEDDVDEISSLLSAVSSSHERDGFLERDHARPAEPDEFQSTKSIWYLILLTLSIGGLQIAWSVELSNGSPYLLSLGLSKSLMALVWIAGPLTGTLVQPYVGMLSDRCRMPWGKRKPFMLGGAAATMVSLMVLAWSKDIVEGFLGLLGADPASQGVKVTTIVFAVLWIYILDFAINTGEPDLRSVAKTSCGC